MGSKPISGILEHYHLIKVYVERCWKPVVQILVWKWRGLLNWKFWTSYNQTCIEFVAPFVKSHGFSLFSHHPNKKSQNQYLSTHKSKPKCRSQCRDVRKLQNHRGSEGPEHGHLVLYRSTLIFPGCNWSHCSPRPWETHKGIIAIALEMSNQRK